MCWNTAARVWDAQPSHGEPKVHGCSPQMRSREFGHVSVGSLCDIQPSHGETQVHGCSVQMSKRECGHTSEILPSQHASSDPGCPQHSLVLLQYALNDREIWLYVPNQYDISLKLWSACVRICGVWRSPLIVRIVQPHSKELAVCGLLVNAGSGVWAL